MSVETGGRRRFGMPQGCHDLWFFMTFLSISTYTNEFRFEFESFIEFEMVLSIPSNQKEAVSAFVLMTKDGIVPGKFFAKGS